MIRLCAWCGKTIGEKPPYEDKGVTHGMCPECYEKNRPKKGVSMPQGKCDQCGTKYVGWALLLEEHRTCQCGGRIIVEGGKVDD